MGSISPFVIHCHGGGIVSLVTIVKLIAAVSVNMEVESSKQSYWVLVGNHFLFK